MSEPLQRIGGLAETGQPHNESQSVEALKRWLTRADQALLSKQTYAPQSLTKRPILLRSYMLLHGEFGGSRPWTGPMSTIADALHVTVRCAHEKIVALEAAGVLEVKRRPGQESEYRLLQEKHYVEMPLSIVLHGNHAVCAVWGALRTSLGPGRSALKYATAVTRMSWARIQVITGLCRTAVAEALRWLRKHGWLSRRVVWESLRPIRRAVCQWKLRMRTPEQNRTPPRQKPGQRPFGRSSRDIVEPQAELTLNPRPPGPPGPGIRAAEAARKSGAEGVEVFATWRKALTS